MNPFESMKAAILLGSVLALGGCNAKAKKEAALQRVYEDSKSAKWAEFKADKPGATQADGVNYQMALERLNEATKEAGAAGADKHEIEGKLSNGSAEVTLEASKRSLAESEARRRISEKSTARVLKDAEESMALADETLANGPEGTVPDDVRARAKARIEARKKASGQ